MKEEIWKDIPGYEGHYQVSNCGQVKSLKFGKERILKHSTDGYGYLMVGLCIHVKQKTFKIHQLVAMAFLNHEPNGYNIIVNHIDNNPLNNNIDNLELVSVRYNSSCHKTDPGVTWYQLLRNKWRTTININKKTIHLGYFTDKQDAIIQYQKALNNIHLYNGDAKAFRALINALDHDIS